MVHGVHGEAADAGDPAEARPASNGPLNAGASRGAPPSARSSSSRSTATTRPRRMMPTRSAVRCTSSRTWDDSRTVPPRRSSPEHHGVELVLYQRVEAAGRLVQDDELGIAHQRLDQGTASACSHATGPAPAVRGPDPDGWRSRDPRATCPRESSEPRQVRERLDPRQAIPEARLSRYVAGPGVDPHTVTPRVHPEDAWRSPTTDRSRPSRMRMVVVLPAPFGPR